MFTDNPATPWAHNDGNAKGPFKYLLNLQTFAEGESGDDDNKDALPTTAEELQKLLQAEGDKRVSQALKTAEDKWKVDYESRLNSEKQEAERLAKLSAAEKEKELVRKQQDELTKKEAEIQRRELKLEAVKILGEKQLPVSFVDLLVREDADSTNSAITEFEKQWQTALQAAVDERIKGKAPAAGGGGGSSSKGSGGFIEEIRKHQARR